MNDIEDRIVFRATPKQILRLNKLYAEGAGKYHTKSEILRRIMEIGLRELEKEH